MEDFQTEYLKHIGIEGEYSSKQISCEICSGSQCTVIRDNVSLGRGKIGKLPVVACNICGFLYQNPRFDQKFYHDFYHHQYRNVISGSATPSQAFIDDQIQRGRILFENVAPYFEKAGAILDVGSSAGGLMRAFIENGWSGLGTDPDSGYVRYGKEILGLNLEEVSAEDMQLTPQSYDFIIIMGSLEHVFDPNLVLQLCRRASKPEGILLLEGRGHPQSHSQTYFNHNHHRYFSLNSIQLMMLKHGWEPFRVTDEPLCGPTRPGGIYALGRATTIPSHSTLLELIGNGKSESIVDILDKFERLDREYPTNK